MKKINIKASLLLVVAMFVTFAVNAQDVNHKWSVGARMTFNDYKGDLGDDFWNFGNAGFALTLSRYVSPSFDVVGDLNIYGINTDLKDGGIGGGVGKMDDKFITATLNLKYKFNNGYILKEEAKLAPYVMLGLGLTKFDRVAYVKGGKLGSNFDYDDDGIDEIFNLALGLTYNLSEKFAVNLEIAMYYANSDSYDGWTDYPKGDKGIRQHNRSKDFYNDKFLHNSIGIVYKF